MSSNKNNFICMNGVCLLIRVVLFDSCEWKNSPLYMPDHQETCVLMESLLNLMWVLELLLSHYHMHI